MYWLRKVYYFLTGCINRKLMAKIVLDDFNEKLFDFNIEDLIFISYDPATKNIVVCLKNKSPKYLPLTPGNILFLKGWVPYQEIQLDKNLKDAEKEILNSIPIKKI